ncbi:plasmid replication protein [Bacillus sp. HNG]|uniref:primase C-terminal domain-containing protein n=1 Tax=Bacillus sp. HNG TaxID=2293325 RepID=UPI000E2FCBDB|nr:primase C-terminal domain-containing protein [Bacillus sp. HNG]RFB11501.1 plasmid replication protein [Bacillus sp. HNG]
MEQAIKRTLKGLYSPIDIMQIMTHDSLYLYKRKGSNAPFDKIAAYEKVVNNSLYSKGAIFVAKSKEDLLQAKGMVITSYEGLEQNYKNLTHWTPNTFRGGTYYDFTKRVIKGHRRENLKQINVLGFDIDSKNVDLYGLYLWCEKVGLPRPNLLLKTPRGFQLFFVLSTPFFIHKQKEYKALRVAERLFENVRHALSKFAPIDKGCIPFGFYRIPKENNILDFYDEPADTSLLLTWSKKYENQEKQNNIKVLFKKDKVLDQTSQAWYKSLLLSTHIFKGHHSASRNNVLLTLALANYASGTPFDDAYDELDQFNTNLDNPLSKNEFDRTIKSAYSGKYKGPKRTYVESMLELWTDGKAKFNVNNGWYKFKKPREERERSHYDEWEEDILLYLNQHTTPETSFLEGSLNVLAATFGMAVSTLKEVLKRSNKIIKQTIGKGRGAVTKVASRAMLFKRLLFLKTKKRTNSSLQLSLFTNLVPKVVSPNQVAINNFNISIERSYLTGASPPV